MGEMRLTAPQEAMLREMSNAAQLGRFPCFGVSPRHTVKNRAAIGLERLGLVAYAGDFDYMATAAGHDWVAAHPEEN